MAAQLGEELGNHKLCLLRRGGRVLFSRRTLPELDPTEPAMMVPFQAGAYARSGFSWKRQASLWGSVFSYGKFSVSTLVGRLDDSRTVIFNLKFGT
jgi:hypothetical protein